MNQLKREEQNRKQRTAILQKQISEIGALNPKPNEEEGPEKYPSYKPKTPNRLYPVYPMLRNALPREGVLELVENAMQQLQSRLKMYTYPSSGAMEIMERLNAVLIEVKDIADELSGMADTINLDEEKLQNMRNRYHAIRVAEKQFFCDFEQLLSMYENAQTELDSMHSDSERIQTLQAQKEHLLNDVTEKAHALSHYREQTAEKFVERVTGELRFLDMPNVILSIAQEKGKLTIQGMDSVTFLISANKGETPKPISKIASGGELSRIMLALKSVIADRDSIPTLIFDQKSDTGVSAARRRKKIGVKLREEISQEPTGFVCHPPSQLPSWRILTT